MMLQSISRLRFLTTGQLHLLHGYEGKYGDKVTRRKLAELERAGLLKSWQPSKYEQKVFYLSKKGADEVASYTGDTVKTYNRSNNTLHQILVSEVYTRLRTETAGRLRVFALDTPVGKSVADAFVRFDVDKRAKLFFLECDRWTESMAHIIDVKLKGYDIGYKSAAFQQKFGIFPEVTFVTVTDTRKRALIAAGERYPFRVRAYTMDEIVSRPLNLI